MRRLGAVLAPLRPGGSLLALKALPLALPPIGRGRLAEIGEGCLLYRILAVFGVRPTDHFLERLAASVIVTDMRV